MGQRRENKEVAAFENSGSRKEAKLEKKRFPSEWKLPGCFAGLC